jgi:hypothetical protein
MTKQEIVFMLSVDTELYEKLLMVALETGDSVGVLAGKIITDYVRSNDG